MTEPLDIPPAEERKNEDDEDKIGKQYANVLAQEQKRQEAGTHMEAAKEFDKVRTLGFATKKDLDEQMKTSIQPIVEELQKMRQENTELREFVLRAKAQGLNTGKLDKDIKKEKPNPLTEL